MSGNAIEIQALSSDLNIEQLFESISDLPYPIWLDSSSDNDGRYHLISAAPEKIIRSDDLANQDAAEFFNSAQGSLDSFQKRNSMPGIPFQGGVIGYVSYDLAATSQGLPIEKKPLLPQGFLGLYLWALVVDKLNQTQRLIFHPECTKETRQTIVSRYFDNSSNPHRTATKFKLEQPFSPSSDKQQYAEDLARINKYIIAGDVYQVNYAQHFNAPYLGNTFEAYLRLRKYAPAPYSAYLQIDEKALLCHSPEQFIEIKGQHVRTSPIKGTAPRSTDKRMDKRNAEVLASSEKDRAENLMIVDLMRNDLGRHCATGSIQASKLFELKSYSNVHHLVSEIVGELNSESSPVDLLQSAMPAGSITGAPKKRAMEIIQELESYQRSFYCGSLGYISLCGNTDMNIGIRSLVADGQSLHCWGGGGIVADSDVQKEYDETLFKVGGLMSELETRFLDEKYPTQTTG